jgi:hypothetical protein
MKAVSRTDLVELLGRLSLYVSEDVVTEDDDAVSSAAAAAMTACSKLALYALDHMVDVDFWEESPLWTATSVRISEWEHGVREDWDALNTDECPEHGEQEVTGSHSSLGSDPYNINHLACGHEVICMGPGDPNHIINS